MTEDEAKTKRCCDGEKTATGKCEGSTCMAWRWIGVASESTSTTGPDYAHYPLPEGEGWTHTFSSEDGQLLTGADYEGGPYRQVWTRPRPDGTRTGVCGLVEQGGTRP